MNNYSNREELIAALTDDITPVKRVKPRDGALLIAFATVVAAATSVATFGWWSGLLEGNASAFFWITNGLLLVLGVASAAALVAGDLPRVGPRVNAPMWSAAMLAVIPFAAVVSLFSSELSHNHSGLASPTLWYWPCGAAALAAGLLVGIASVLFLRRGAPVSIERSGWLTGLAAGALGAVAYGITCPLDEIAHVGIVHVVPVAISAVIGRLVVPPLIRW